MTDLAIQGNGFFVLKNGESTLFTRDGALGLDKDGRLVNPATGYRVQGWLAQDINGQQVLSHLRRHAGSRVPIGSKDPAKATDRVDMACNLDKRTSEVPPNATPDTVEQGTWRVEEKIYDSFGAPHTLRVEYRKVVGQPNQWQGTVAIDPGGPGPDEHRRGPRSQSGRGQRQHLHGGVRQPRAPRAGQGRPGQRVRSSRRPRHGRLLRRRRALLRLRAEATPARPSGSTSGPSARPPTRSRRWPSAHLPRFSRRTATRWDT